MSRLQNDEARVGLQVGAGRYPVLLRGVHDPKRDSVTTKGKRVKKDTIATWVAVALSLGLIVYMVVKSL